MSSSDVYRDFVMKMPMADQIALAKLILDHVQLPQAADESSDWSEVDIAEFRDHCAKLATMRADG